LSKLQSGMTNTIRRHSLRCKCNAFAKMKRFSRLRTLWADERSDAANFRVVMILRGLLLAAAVAAADVGSLIVAPQAAVAFDASNGAFGAGNAAYSMALAPTDTTNLYVGGDKGGLVWFVKNATAFSLKQAYSRTQFGHALLSVKHIAVSSDGAFMAVNGDYASPDFGNLGIFKLAADGTPSLLSEQAFPDIKNAVFAPDSSSDLYTIDQTSLELQHWRYSAGTARFSLAESVPVTDSTAIDGLFISPDGRNVYVHDSGTHTSYNYARNTATGVVTAPQTSTLAGNQALNGADGIGRWSDLKFTVDGRWGFALETFSDLIVTLSRDTATGALSVVHKLQPVYDSGAAVALSSDASFALAADGSGDLYILGADADQIGWFRFSEAVKQVALMGWTSTGDAPRVLLLDGRTSSSLYVSFSAVSSNYRWKGQQLVRTPAATLIIVMATTVQGESAVSFAASEQAAFAAAVAQVAGITPASRVTVTQVADVTPAAGATSAVRVTYSIAGLASAAESSAAAAAVIAATAADSTLLLQRFTTAATARGAAASSLTASAMTASTVVTSDAPTPAPVGTVPQGSGSTDAAAIASSTVVVTLAVLGLAGVLLWLQRRRKRARSVQIEEDKYVLALQGNPKDALAHNNYGHFLQHKRGDIAGAERHYRLAVKYDATAAYAHNCLGHLLQVRVLLL
jgi:6-phosphogluconolactonase (cycloisomerase 2 family)